MMNLPIKEDKGEAARIRDVESSHIGDLIRIADETNLSHWSAQSYLEEMQNANAIMMRLVATDNSTIGFVVGRIVLAVDIETQADAEIYNIAVTKCEQGLGRGQQLLDRFIDICKEKRASRIWLEVRESNQQAIRFYEKNGFALVQTRQSFYDNPREHALLMKLSLK